MFETRAIPESRSIALLKRVFTIVVSVYLVIGMISAYRAFYQVHSVEIQSADVLQNGSAISTNVVSYARGPVAVRIELVQDGHSAPIAFFRVPGNQWALFDPRTQHGSQTTVLTPDLLKQFTTGQAIVRATALGCPQWGRLPPPLIRERVVNIQRN